MMKTEFILATCSLALAGCAGQSQHVAPTTAAPTASEDAWTIGPRSLPAPSGASDVLRNAIAKAPQPDIARHIDTAPTSAEHWAQLLSSADSGGAQNARALAKSMSVTITEDQIAGVTVRMLMPDAVRTPNQDRLFVHVHGGAYVFGGGLAGTSEAIMIAHHVQIPVLSIDYRMPPEHPFPAAVDDVVAVWRGLLRQRPASSMALGGTSTGGGLTLASTLEFKRIGLELPGALWAGTPWADLSKTGDSQFINQGIDRVLVIYDGLLAGAAKLYADGLDLKTPLISPVYGDFEGFPPTYLVTGTRDLFLSDTVRVHRKMRNAGVIADLNVYEGMSHAEYNIVLRSPESQQVFAELGLFLNQHLK